MPEALTITTSLDVGDYYEDCAYHPCLCIESNREDDMICGVSLVDGSYPRCCSFVHCGVRKLSLQEALHWKFFGSPDVELQGKGDWTKHVPHDKWADSHRIPSLGQQPPRTSTDRCPSAP
jgi:hypothetical protein